MDTNTHTCNLEFYGSASSVAFLRHVETLSESQSTLSHSRASQTSLASLLHNTDFRPNSNTSPETTTSKPGSSSDRFYFRVATRFLDAYFRNIHLIQPLFDEGAFLTRCEALWFSKEGQQPSSFLALYYATLSLGSLVMMLEDHLLLGQDRFTWSRMLFNEAQNVLTKLGQATDIEMVQCFYMMVGGPLPWWMQRASKPANKTPAI